MGGRRDPQAWLWVPPVLAVAAIPVFGAAVARGQSLDNAVPSYVWLMVAWAVGRVVRDWRQRTLALEQANRELAELPVV
ncbi:hypothetical protein [Dactylosporangium salmoneum]|uniref:Uncharacterized protein n=1 Tax=Dactylosporangium salmoneum TaxID=53361 RepID=A0ABN3GM98_9ACTN